MESKQNKLRQYVELIPVLLFCINAIMYGCFIMSEYFGTLMLMERFYWFMQHTFDATLVTLVMMFYISIRDKWRFLPKICTYALFALWLNNFPYVVFGYETGIYFSIFATVIYLTTFILSLRVLTNR